MDAFKTHLISLLSFYLDPEPKVTIAITQPSIPAYDEPADSQTDATLESIDKMLIKCGKRRRTPLRLTAGLGMGIKSGQFSSTQAFTANFHSIKQQVEVALAQERNPHEAVIHCQKCRSKAISIMADSDTVPSSTYLLATAPSAPDGMMESSDMHATEELRLLKAQMKDATPSLMATSPRRYR